jgi:hypothetical protein
MLLRELKIKRLFLHYHQEVLINIITITVEGRQQTAVDRKEWASVIKKAKVFRGPYSQGLLLLLLHWTSKKRMLQT